MPVVMSCGSLINSQNNACAAARAPACNASSRLSFAACSFVWYLYDAKPVPIHDVAETFDVTLDIDRFRLALVLQVV
eukprot:CAMPEP_0179144008 /NCGR_PEP_ID=MMETSP0796-20121207/69323_1 /TAXON_ID=73915 /ORGANISM="Pyrodinium bahamense, Strain pbaha01" /LENGTH=76 /DNA_ID=CAMNT_0020844135 /DNA_START=342 /DNA_END=572 /DNA_ORIENTATION=-